MSRIYDKFDDYDDFDDYRPSRRSSAPRRSSFDAPQNYGRRDNRNSRRRKNQKRQILKALIPVAIVVVLIIVIVIMAITTGLFEGIGYSSEKADLNEYFNVTSDNEAAVVKDGEVTEERIRVQDGVCYLPLETVKEEYNDRFYYDVNDSALLYTNAEGVISAPVGQNSYSLNGNTTNTEYTTSFLEGETLFVALPYVRLYANFSYELFGGSGEPYRVNIQNTWGTKVYANLSKDGDIREDADKKSAILESLDKGTTVEILTSESEDWMHVMTEDLVSGYIEKKYLDEKYEQAETPVTDVQDVVIPTVADGSTVVLAWHNVTTVDAASYLNDYSSYFKYFNTISPTWFYLSDNDGTVASIASSDYVTTAHNAGLKVWGLVENMTYEGVDTYEILSYSSKRQHVIEQLIQYAKDYDLDGINVDFEQLSTETGEPFIQFIRELSLAAHKENLVVSVDNYVPQGYTSHYNRKEQGVFADYVIIMGYDEHYAGSTESGSVASLSFVMDGIQQTVAEVPSNKVINAVPFYTRIWTEIPKTDAEIAAGAGEEGFVNYNLDVQTLSASDAYASVRSNGAEITWNEEAGQNYAEWTNSGATVKCWLEDGDSMKARMDVMQANNLAGVAVWQLSYSSEDMWDAIAAAYPVQK